jgi:hypothetical protein
MTFTQRFDHVGVALRDAAAAASVFSDVLDGEYVGRWEVPEEGFRFAQYRFPNKMKPELLEPMGTGASWQGSWSAGGRAFTTSASG